MATDVSGTRYKRRARRGSVSLSEVPMDLAAELDAILDKTPSSSSTATEKEPEHRDADTFAVPWFWVPDKKEGYVAGMLRSDPDTSPCELVTDREEVLKVSKDNLGPQIISASSLTTDYDDMVKMEEVNQPMILHNLRLRFARLDIYTNIGTILVSLNPYTYEGMDRLYGITQVNKYHALRPGDEAPPHLFAIGSAAYRGLANDRESQAVIISGESGAGKTEATKKILQYLAEVAGYAEPSKSAAPAPRPGPASGAGAGPSSSSAGSGGAPAEGVADRVLAANPVLEAFGNAKTVRNNNSSRFGKWMEVQFDGHSRIGGCKVSNYLLEKSRVTTPAPSERSFHIFYQLIRGLQEADRQALRLTAPQDYAYLSTTTDCFDAPRIDDQEEFTDAQDAMERMHFVKEEQMALFRVVAAVLHLGNIKFEVRRAQEGEGEVDDAAVAPGSKPDLLAAAACLLVDSETLEREVCSKVIVVRGKATRSPLPPEGAADARNALAKSLYGRMFDWLVGRVNASLKAKDGADVGGPGRTIGVLDIFGFEIFEHNSFEQLCINFCNEKLQQHFNAHVFKEDVRVYEQEGIDYSDVTFPDNVGVLALLEHKRHGILSMLDDEVLLPNGSDDNFLSRTCKAHGETAEFIDYTPGVSRTKSGGKKSSRLSSKAGKRPFGVVHYAGQVTYDATSFYAKNKDELYPNLVDCMRGSSSDFMRHGLFEPSVDPFVQGQRRVGAGDSAADAAGGGASGRASPSSERSGAASPAISRTSSSRGRGKGKGTLRTQVGHFRRQLDSLMKTLNSASPHYVRCVKPNGYKQAGLFEGSLVLQQLQYSGVFEAVRIRQQGFPFRLTYRRFYGRYHMVVDIREVEKQALGEAQVAYRGKRKEPWAESFYRTCSEAIVRKLLEQDGGEVASSSAGSAAAAGGSAAGKSKGKGKGEADSDQRSCFERDVRFGKTMVLYRAEPNRKLQRLRDRSTRAAAPPLQRWYRGFAGRLDYLRLRALNRGLRAATRMRDEGRLEAVLKEAEEVQDGEETSLPSYYAEAARASIQSNASLAGAKAARGTGVSAIALGLVSRSRTLMLRPRNRPLPTPRTAQEARKVLWRVREERQAREALEALVDRDPMEVETELKQALDKAKQLGLGQEDAFGTCKKRYDSIAMRKEARKLLAEGTAGYDRAKIEKGLGLAAEMAAEWGEVLESAARREASSAMQTIEQEEEALSDLSTALSTGGVAPSDALSLVDSLLVSQGAVSKARLRALTASGAGRVLGNALQEASSSRAGAGGDAGAAAGSAGQAASGAGQDLGKGASPGAGVADSQSLDDDAQANVQVQVVFDDRSLDRSLGGSVPIAVQWDHVQGPARAMRSGGRALVTPDGKSLVGMADAIVDLRGALSAANTGGVRWGRVGAAVKRCDELPSLPEAVRAEVQAAKDAVKYAELLQGIARGIVSGAARFSGEDGVYHPDTADVTALEGPVTDTAAQCRTFGPAGAAIALVGAVVLRLRRALRAGDWDAVDTIVKDDALRATAGLYRPSTGGSGGAMDPAAESARLLSRAGSGSDVTTDVTEWARVELAAAEDELETQRVVMALRDSMKTGALGGEVGGVETGGVSVRTLDDAVRLASGARSKQAKQLLEVIVSLLRPVRMAVLGGDWDAVAETVAAVYYEDDLPAECRQEVQLAIHEAENRAILVELEKGIASGRVAGEIGALDLGSTDPGPCDAAVATAEDLGTRTVEASQLLAVARQVAAMRTAALEDKLEDAARCAHGALRLAAGETEQKDGREDGDALNAESGQPSGAGGGDESRPASGTAASGAIGTAVSPDKQGTGAIPVELPDGILEECKLVVEEGGRRRALRLLGEGLQDGAVKGEVGSLDVGAIRVQALQSALGELGSQDLDGSESKQLARSCREVLRLRVALLADNWAAARAVLGSCILPGTDAPAVEHEVEEGQEEGSKGATDDGDDDDEIKDREAQSEKNGPGQASTDAGTWVPHPLCVEECALAARHVDDWRVRAGLIAALERGQVTGQPDALDLVGLADGGVAALERAIATAHRLGASTSSQAAALLEGSSRVMAVREALLRWVEGVTSANDGNVTSALKEVSPADEAEQETDGGRSWARVELALRRCGLLGQGSVSVRDGGDDEESQGKSSSTGDEDQAAGAAASGAGDLPGAVQRVCGRELHLINDAAKDRALVAALRIALSTGAATGTVGSLSLLGVETGALSKAVVLAGQLGTRSARAEVLVHSASLVLRARQALRDGEYESLKKAVEEAAEQGASPEATEELNMLVDEVEDHRMRTALTNSIATGGPSGDAGELDSVGVRTREIERAIKTANALGAKSARVKSLLHTARVVRDLRACVQTGDWEGASAVLQEQGERESAIISESLGYSASASSPGKPVGAAASGAGAGAVVASPDRHQQQPHEPVAIAQEALPEIALVRAHVRHRQAVEIMRDALSVGAMRGKTGQVDLGTVQLGSLDAALAQVRSWKVMTKKVRALVASAETIRSLRASLVGRDWEQGRAALATTAGSDLVAAGRAVAEAREGAQAQQGVRVIEAEQERALLRRAAGPLALEGAEEAYAVSLEINDRVASAALRRAMSTGGPVKDPKTGQLDVSLLRREALKDAVRLAEQTGAHTAQSRLLLRTARLLLALRDSLWKGSKEGVENALAEAAGVPGLLAWAYVAGGHGDVENGDASPPSSPAGQRVGTSAASTGGGAAGGSASAVGSTKHDPSGPHVALMKQVLPISVANELRWSREEIDNIDCVAALVTGLRNGAAKLLASNEDEGDDDASGPGGSSSQDGKGGGAAGSVDGGEDLLDMSAVSEKLSRPVFASAPDPAPLIDALQQTEALGTHTPEAMALESAARAVLAMRDAARSGNWGEVAKAGYDPRNQAAVRGELVPPFAGREAASLIAIAERRHAEHAVHDALTQGQVRLSGASIDDAPTADVTPLDRAISIADRIAARSPVLAALCRAAVIARRLRRAVAAQDWQGVASAVEQARIQAVRSRKSKQSDGTEVAGASQGSGYVYDEAGAAGDELAISFQRAPPGEPAAFTASVGPAAAEFALAETEMVSRSVDDRLRSALYNGRARGPVGALQVQEAQTEDLENAIAFAARAPRLSRRTQCLLRTCRAVLVLRHALTAMDWEAVREAADKAHEAGFLLEGGAALSSSSSSSSSTDARAPASDPTAGRLPLHPISRSEVESARKEAADALVSAAVRRALREGRAVPHGSLSAAARGTMGLRLEDEMRSQQSITGGAEAAPAAGAPGFVSPRRKLTLMLRAVSGGASGDEGDTRVHDAGSSAPLLGSSALGKASGQAAAATAGAGPVAVADLGAVSTYGLRDALRLAREEGVCSHATAQLVLSARLLLRLRSAAVAEDWGLVHSLASALRTRGLGVAVCRAEGIAIPEERSSAGNNEGGTAADASSGKAVASDERLTTGEDSGENQSPKKKGRRGRRRSILESALAASTAAAQEAAKDVGGDSGAGKGGTSGKPSKSGSAGAPPTASAQPPVSAPAAPPAADKREPWADMPLERAGASACPESEDEIAVLQAHASDRRAAQVLQEAIGQAAVTGHAGDLSVPEDAQKVLAEAVSIASELGCKSLVSLRLLDGCRALRRLRGAVQAKDWRAVLDAGRVAGWAAHRLELADAESGKSAAAAIAREVALCTEESANVRSLSTLRSALRHGGMHRSAGRSNSHSQPLGSTDRGGDVGVDVATLQRAVDAVDAGDSDIRDALHRATEQEDDLPFGAVPGSPGNKGASGNKGGSASRGSRVLTILARGGLFLPSAENGPGAIAGANGTMQSPRGSATSSGEQAGRDPATPLQAVPIAARTHESRQLLAAARCVLRLRQAYRAADWPKAAEAANQLLDGGIVDELEAAETDAAQHNGTGTSAAHAAPAPSGVALCVGKEAKAAQDTCLLRARAEALRQALRQGRIEGQPGELALHAVSSASLAAAVRKGEALMASFQERLQEMHEATEARVRSSGAAGEDAAGEREQEETVRPASTQDTSARLSSLVTPPDATELELLSSAAAAVASMRAAVVADDWQGAQAAATVAAKATGLASGSNGTHRRTLSDTLGRSQRSSAERSARLHSIVPQESREEVELVRLELRDRRAVEDLRRAASDGGGAAAAAGSDATAALGAAAGAGNSGGGGDATDQLLRSSLRRAEDLPQRSLRASALTRAGRALVELREAARASDWKAAAAVLDALECESKQQLQQHRQGAQEGAVDGAAHPGTRARVAQLALHELSEHSGDELRRYRDAIEDDECGSRLRAALRGACAESQDGSEVHGTMVRASGALAASGTRPALTFSQSTGEKDAAVSTSFSSSSGGAGTLAVERMLQSVSLAVQAGCSLEQLLERDGTSRGTDSTTTGVAASTSSRKPTPIETQRKLRQARLQIAAVVAQMDALETAVDAAADAGAGASNHATGRLLRVSRELLAHLQALTQLDSDRLVQTETESREHVLGVLQEAAGAREAASRKSRSGSHANARAAELEAERATGDFYLVRSCALLSAVIARGAEGRKVCDALRQAMTSNRVGGSPGALQLVGCSVVRLDDGLQSCYRLLSKAAREEDSGYDGDEQEEGDNDSGDDPGRDVLAAQRGLPLRELQVLATSAGVVRSVRSSLMSSDWPGVEKAVETSGQQAALICREALPEVRLAVGELKAKAILEGPLGHALSTGGPTGAIGAMQTGRLHLASLDKGIRHANAVGADTPEAKQLLRTAVAIRRVRAAAQANDWPSVQKLLVDAEKTDVAPVATAEVARFRAEVEARRIEEYLSAAIRDGSGVVRAGSAVGDGGSGVAPRLDPALVSTTSLETAVQATEAAAEAGDPGTGAPGVQMLLRTARVLLGLRRALLENDSGSMVRILGQAQEAPLHESAEGELEALMTEFDSRSVCAELGKALAGGRATGEPGNLELGAIQTDALQQAISYAQRVGASSDRARVLLDSARAILLIRYGLGAQQHVDWTSVQQGLEAAEAQPMAPEAEEELDLVRRDVVVRGISEDLRQALAQHGPVERRVGGKQGEAVVLDTSSVTVSGLDDAIGSFDGLDAAPEELRAAVRVARGIRAVRAALLDGDWDEAEAAAARAVETERQAIGLGVGVDQQGDGGVEDGASSGRRGPSGGAGASESKESGGKGASHGGDIVPSREEQEAMDREALRQCPPAAASELLLVRRLLADRREVREVLERLEQASSEADEAGMEAALRAAYAMGLHETGEPQARAAVHDTRERFVAIVGNRDALSKALRDRDLPALEVAVEEGTRLDAKCDEYKEGRAVVKHMTMVRGKSDAAIESMDGDRLREALELSQRAGFDLPTTPKLEQLLKLPGRQLLKMRLHGAIRRGDAQAVAEATVEIKRLHFSDVEAGVAPADREEAESGTAIRKGLRAYELRFCRALRTKSAFYQGEGNARYQRRVRQQPGVTFGSPTAARPGQEPWLSFSPRVVPTSLTVQQDMGVRLSVALSRNILGYCGDASLLHDDPAAAAYEVLLLGIGHPSLRDEIYAQLLRQHTGNPSEGSKGRIRELLRLCAGSFSPSDDMENVVELFLRRSGDRDTLLALHRTAFVGARDRPPTADEVKRATVRYLDAVQAEGQGKRGASGAGGAVRGGDGVESGSPIAGMAQKAGLQTEESNAGSSAADHVDDEEDEDALEIGSPS